MSAPLTQQQARNLRDVLDRAVSSKNKDEAATARGLGEFLAALSQPGRIREPVASAELTKPKLALQVLSWCHSRTATARTVLDVSVELYAKAISALAILCRIRENSVAVCASREFIPVVRFIGEREDRGLQLAAAQLFAIVTVDPKNSALLGQERLSTLELVSYLRVDRAEPELIRNTAIALGSLFNIESARVAGLSANCFEALLACLETYAAEPAPISSLLLAVGALVKQPAAGVAAVDLNLVAVTTKRMREHPQNAEVQRWGLWVLANLLKNGRQYGHVLAQHDILGLVSDLRDRFYGHEGISKQRQRLEELMKASRIDYSIDVLSATNAAAAAAAAAGETITGDAESGSQSSRSLSSANMVASSVSSAPAHSASASSAAAAPPPQHPLSVTSQPQLRQALTPGMSFSLGVTTVTVAPKPQPQQQQLTTVPDLPIMSLFDVCLRSTSSDIVYACIELLPRLWTTEEFLTRLLEKLSSLEKEEEIRRLLDIISCWIDTRFVPDFCRRPEPIFQHQLDGLAAARRPAKSASLPNLHPAPGSLVSSASNSGLSASTSHVGSHSASQSSLATAAAAAATARHTTEADTARPVVNDETSAVVRSNDTLFSMPPLSGPSPSKPSHGRVAPVPPRPSSATSLAQQSVPSPRAHHTSSPAPGADSTSIAASSSGSVIQPSEATDSTMPSKEERTKKKPSGSKMGKGDKDKLDKGDKGDRVDGKTDKGDKGDKDKRKHKKTGTMRGRGLLKTNKTTSGDDVKLAVAALPRRPRSYNKCFEILEQILKQLDAPSVRSASNECSVSDLIRIRLLRAHHRFLMPDAPPLSIFKDVLPSHSIDVGPEAFHKFFMSLSPETVADRLTFVEFSLFRSIRREEFFEMNWKRKALGSRKASLFVLALVDRFNDVAYWVATSILNVTLDAHARAAVIERMIALARRLHKSGNFNTLMAVIAGLEMNAVERLKVSWNLISSASRKSLSKLASFFDPKHNYSRYRGELRARREKGVFTMPYIGLMSRDWVFMEEVPLTLSDVKMINGTRITTVMKLLEELSYFQRQELPFSAGVGPDEKDLLYFCTHLPSVSEEDLERLSYEIQKPRSLVSDSAQSVTSTASNENWSAALETSDLSSVSSLSSTVDLHGGETSDVTS